LIESIIEEEEHGLMLHLVGEKRTATMILEDNKTIVGAIPDLP
jgi:hypothetical protein